VAYSYSIDDPAKNSKRTLAFILTVLIHVFFFWVLASGLGAKMVQTVMGPVETKMIEELPDDAKEPPPPPPDIEQPVACCRPNDVASCRPGPTPRSVRPRPPCGAAAARGSARAA
jgi:hypothetical protein